MSVFQLRRLLSGNAHFVIRAGQTTARPTDTQTHIKIVLRGLCLDGSVQSGRQAQDAARPAGQIRKQQTTRLLRAGVHALTWGQQTAELLAADWEGLGECLYLFLPANEGIQSPSCATRLNRPTLNQVSAGTCIPAMLMEKQWLETSKTCWRLRTASSNPPPPKKKKNFHSHHVFWARRKSDDY